MNPKIMLIGLGDLGSVLLEFLARSAHIGVIVVGSRNEKAGAARCNLARSGAIAQGFSTDIRFILLDLHQTERTAEIIQNENPDLIFSAATLQSWWTPYRLPPVQSALFDQAGFGVWLPVHLTLTRKLMEAVRRADYQGFVLTAPYPDVINQILKRLNLAPTCGVGNVAEVVPKIHWLAAKRLHASLNEVRVHLVAHHALLKYTFRETPQLPAVKKPPFFLRVAHRGQDVTAEIEAEKWLFAPYPLTPGRAIHFLTAATSVRLIQALFSEEDVFLHTPAPAGLPGGYPVTVSSRGVEVAEIPDLPLETAISINEHSHRFDGVERIEADGTVVFCAESAAILRDTLGYDCPRLHPDEAETRAQELIQRFKEYAKRYGVEV